MLTPKTWRLALAAAVTVTAGGAALFGWVNGVGASPDTLNQAVGAESSQIALVKSTFTAAMRAAQSAGSPSDAYVKASVSAIHAHAATHPVPATDRARLLTSGQQQLSRYFPPKLLSRVEVGLNNMLKMDSSANQVNLGAGVSKIVFRSVTVAGRSASIEADVTAWAKSYIRQSSKGSWQYTDPVGTMRYTATMTLTSDGRWQVASLVGDFLPGEGP